MNNKALYITTVFSLVVAIGMGVLALTNKNAATGWADCYADAYAVAEESIDTQQEFADSVIGDLTNILLGGDFNAARLDRLGQEMKANNEAFEELEERC